MAVEPVDWSRLTLGEQARLSKALLRGGVRVHRGKSAGSADREIDEIYAGAWERIAAEQAARETKRRQTVLDKAARRAG